MSQESAGAGERMEWAERIQWLADRYEGGSRRALGRKIGLSGQAVSAWVRGESVPSGNALEAIVAAYPELRPRWLLTGRGRPTVPAASERSPPEDEIRPSGWSPVVEEVDHARSAYEAGRRDAVLEMRQMLKGHSAASFSAGER